MIEYDDPDFAQHSQMYYYLIVNLEALDEPEEAANSGPALVLMKNPGSGGSFSPFPMRSMNMRSSLPPSICSLPTPDLGIVALLKCCRVCT
jgi:hypothetical protein